MGMHNEIERKFLIKEEPSLHTARPVSQERYFIPQEEGSIVEEGYKCTDNVFEHELKIAIASDERTREVIVVTKEEFEECKKRGTNIIFRDSYRISEHPRISIKKYHGTYEGLSLAEVEFDSHEAAEEFEPLPWMGAEVTDTPIGKDSRLVLLSWKEVKKVIEDVDDSFDFDESKLSFL